MSDYQIRLLETTDTHAYVEDYDYYTDKPKNQGLVYVKTAIDQTRQEWLDQGHPEGSILVIDNGDAIQGSSLGNYLQQAYTPGATPGTGTWTTPGVEPTTKIPIYGALEILGAQVSVLGNHEFNFGLDYLKSSIADVDFPILAANVFNDPNNSLGAPADEPTFQQYAILDATLYNSETQETEDVQIGLAGFVTEDIMNADARHLKGEVYTKPINEVAAELVPEMRAAGADLLFGLVHSNHGDINDPALPNYKHDTALGVAEVDTDLDGIPDYHALFGGHEHKRSDNTLVTNELNGVPFLMSGSWGDTLGVLDLSLTKEANGNWTVANHEVSFIDIKGKNEANETIPLFEANQELRDYIAPWHEATIEYMGQEVAEISNPMTSYFAHGFDDPLLETFAEIQIAYGQDYVQKEDSIFEAKNLPVLSVATGYKGGREGGTDYTVIDGPSMLNKDIASMYIYDNNVASIVQITGAELEDYLEYSAFQAYNTIDPNSSEPQVLNKVPEQSRGYNVDFVKGENGSLTYEIDVTQEPEFDENGPTGKEGRIINLKYNGEPVQDSDEFYLVMNNFRSDGGGGYPIDWDEKKSQGKLYSSPDANQAIFANYFASAEGVVDTSLPNEQPTFRPVVSSENPVEVIYISSNNEDAKSTYASSVGATYLSDYQNEQGENIINGKSGFANYVITLEPSVEENSEQPESSDQYIFGTAGADQFDSVLTTGGFSGEGQILFTGSGDDRVDVSLASGDNRIDLGSGNDLLFAGTNNRILAGLGDDTLFLSSEGGNNVVTGGDGVDQFWIVTDVEDLVSAPNVITDFTVAEDVIGLANTDLSFSDLTITQTGADVVIGLLDQELAVLSNLQASTITESSFVFA